MSSFGRRKESMSVEMISGKHAGKQGIVVKVTAKMITIALSGGSGTVCIKRTRFSCLFQTLQGKIKKKALVERRAWENSKHPRVLERNKVADDSGYMYAHYQNSFAPCIAG